MYVTLDFHNSLIRVITSASEMQHLSNDDARIIRTVLPPREDISTTAFFVTVSSGKRVLPPERRRTNVKNEPELLLWTDDFGVNHALVIYPSHVPPSVEKYLNTKARALRYV